MTEKEIIQKIYEVIKLVDCMQYNPSVDFNYLKAKGAYNIIKNQVEHIEAENAELRATLSKMETVEKELRARLEKAAEEVDKVKKIIEPTMYTSFCGFVVRWCTLMEHKELYGTQEAAEAKLKELKENV